MARTVLQIPATPDHVRTARLVAAAAARQAELDEEQVDSIALATDEACILALGESADWRATSVTNAEVEPVEQDANNSQAPDGRSLSIALESNDNEFAVEVAVANAESETRYDEVAAADPNDDIDPLSDRALTMTLIRAVVPEVLVEESTVGFAMRMAWPS
ncbi:MAG: ATP-binding protein [Candidatus Nanopelagicales bacterium]